MPINPRGIGIIKSEAMRKFREQLRHLLASRIRYKITRGGVLFTAVIMLVGAAAVFSGNNLLFLIVAAMMATLLVSGFVSRLCLAALELDFLVPEHVAASRTVPARLYVSNRKEQNRSTDRKWPNRPSAKRQRTNETDLLRNQIGDQEDHDKRRSQRVEILIAPNRRARCVGLNRSE